MNQSLKTPLDPASISDSYGKDGYCFPIDALNEDEAAASRRELEALEQKCGGGNLGNRTQLNYPHVIFRFADALVRHPRILDAVEAVLGPDLMVWGATFFIKEPHTRNYVSWHQDLRYWGLDSEDQVSAWLALSPVTESNGCMRFVPGSHRGEMVRHRDTYSDCNVLTRGQEADIRIDESNTVKAELAPGQISLHHGKLLHASGPNHSHERRIGLTINYIAPHVRQMVAREDFAVLVRGNDRFGNFQHVPPPVADLSANAMAWHARILEAQNEAMYDGAQYAAT